MMQVHNSAVSVCTDPVGLEHRVIADMQDCFEGVLGADLMGEHAKRDVEAFPKVCMHAGATAKHPKDV